MQCGMSDMGFRPNEYDIDILFPSDVVLTGDDVLKALDFNYRRCGDQDNGRCVEDYFRQFVKEIYEGQIGKRSEILFQLCATRLKVVEHRIRSLYEALLKTFVLPVLAESRQGY